MHSTCECFNEITLKNVTEDNEEWKVVVENSFSNFQFYLLMDIF